MPVSRRSLLATLAALVLTRPAAAQQPPAPLSPQDQADLRRAEDYLNAIKTLRARFLQVAPNGATSTGLFYLSRPGRLRLEYDPPVPHLLVANGSSLIHFDKSLKTTAYLGLDSTPAGLLVRETIRLSGDVTVTAVERGPGALRISLIQTKDPRAGRIVLVFGESPLMLSSWTIVDAQGQATRVALVEARADVPLEPALFRFVEPIPTQRGGDGN